MPQPTKRIVSLQRKLSTAIFLVLIIVLCTLEFASFRRNMANHRAVTLDNLERAEDAFLALLERSYIELFRIADNYDIRSASAKSLQRLAQPSLLAGIDSVRFFSADGHDLLSESNPLKLTRSTRNALEQVAESQRPTGFVDCKQQCLQRAFVPIIAEDGSELIVNINRGPDIVMQDFFKLTNMDVALLAKEVDNGITIETILLASNAATSRDRILPLLEKIITKGPQENHFFGKLNSRYFSAKHFPLNGAVSPELSVLIHAPETGTEALIESEFKDTVITVLVTLLFSMAAITLILRPPLQRVLGLANLLRLLPESEFASARSLLAEIAKSRQHRDETDVLRESIGSVIGDLERLNEKNNEQREKLKQKIFELTEATKFNDMLLDASPLVIIIHESDGTIHSINALGREMINTINDDGRPPNINDWVRNDFQQRSLSDALANLMQDEGKTVQGEMPLFDRNGLRVEILWVHRAIRVKGQQRILSMGMDVTEQHEAVRSLQWLGRHDRVTGLLNRLSFIDEAQSHIVHAGENTQFDIVLIDIDDFARFNDQFDFSTGDKLLLELARYISMILPEGSLLARSGSGEFIALIEVQKELDEADYHKTLESLTRYTIDTTEGSENVHLSVVLNHLRSQAEMAIDQLISDTTALMRRVKSKARGQVFVATEEHIDRLSRQEKYHMKDLIQQALDENRLLLFYQPIIHIHNQVISHCECLVRLLDEEGQFIPPYKFLGVAAEIGLMSQIDFAVIEMAMQQQRRWQDSGVDIGLSINLTAPTMELPDFEIHLKQLIEKTGADPSKLIFEVVETDALDSIHEANTLLKNFRKIGARIALDDFGVGFTSFEYVRELPVDFIKIDQSFVRFIHERPNDQALVRSMIEMSHSLNKQVIVEGVETQEAMEIVRKLGAEYVQGYFISKPMPLDALNLNMPLGHLLNPDSDNQD